MFTTKIDKGRTVKTVTVAFITNETDEQILAHAMHDAGEKKSSLFGWRVVRSEVIDGQASVDLYTD